MVFLIASKSSRKLQPEFFKTFGAKKTDSIDSGDEQPRRNDKKAARLDNLPKMCPKTAENTWAPSFKTIKV